jgi:hypothetical protein
MKISDFLNEEKTRLDPACWTGKKIGTPKTKVKGGVRVNNCVPKEGVAEGSDDKFSVADKVEDLVDQYRLYDKRGWTDYFTNIAGRKLEVAEIRREMEYASKFLQLLDSIRMRSDYRGQQDPRSDQELIDLSNQWLSLFNKATGEFKGMSGQGVAEGFNGEYDDEAGMAHTNLITIARAAQGLLDTIDDNDNLPEWAQEKIAKVEGMLVTVWNYLQSQKAQGIDPEIAEMYDAMDQLAEEMALKNRVSVDAVWESFEALDDHMLYETAAWRRKEGKSAKGGLNAKGVASYRRENPGSKLQTAVTTKPSKLKPGSKAAKRRKSFCARMSGVKGPAKKPNGKPTRKTLALRKWNC